MSVAERTVKTILSINRTCNARLMKKFPKGFLTNCPFISSPFFLKCNPLLLYPYDVNMFKYMKFPMLKLCLFRTLEIISTLITQIFYCENACPALPGPDKNMRYLKKNMQELHVIVYN